MPQSPRRGANDDRATNSIAEIHLAYMPYSHSAGIPICVAVLAWLIIERGVRRADLGSAVGLGIVSHLVLNLATHAHDIVLWPGWSIRNSDCLYECAPIVAFIVEFLYGILCWHVYRGGVGLLAL